MTIYRYFRAAITVSLATVVFSACSPDKELHMDRLERALIHTWIANTTGEWATAETRGKEARKPAILSLDPNCTQLID